LGSCWKICEIMIKLLIFSDNHRDREVVYKMLSANKDVDHIISLGDSEMSESELSNLNIIGVKGNYPFEPKFPYDLELTFGNFRILFTHGHHFNVKSGDIHIYHLAKDHDCQIAFFGHTHMYSITDYEDIVLVNPGSLTYPKMHPNKTYGLISLLKNQFQIDIIDVDTLETVKTYTKYL